MASMLVTPTTILDYDGKAELGQFLSVHDGRTSRVAEMSWSSDRDRFEFNRVGQRRLRALMRAWEIAKRSCGPGYLYGRGPMRWIAPQLVAGTTGHFRRIKLAMIRDFKVSTIELASPSTTAYETSVFPPDRLADEGDYDSQCFQSVTLAGALAVHRREVRALRRRFYGRA